MSIHLDFKYNDASSYANYGVGKSSLELIHSHHSPEKILSELKTIETAKLIELISKYKADCSQFADCLHKAVHPVAVYALNMATEEDQIMINIAERVLKSRIKKLCKHSHSKKEKQRAT